MDINFLENLINTDTGSYSIYREKHAQIVLENPKTFKGLIELVFNKEAKSSIRASWVLDFVTREQQELLYPHLNYFTKNICSLTEESALRPICRICEQLSLKYQSKDNSEIKLHLKKSHIDKIIEVGFDFLINDHKVAVKAYTMVALFQFGKDYNWVHDALLEIITKDINNESAAYKARGKRILKDIQKFKARKHL